jgi:hypothetical protein
MGMEQTDCSETLTTKLHTPEIIRKKHTTFKTWLKSEIKNCKIDILRIQDVTGKRYDRVGLCRPVCVETRFRVANVRLYDINCKTYPCLLKYVKFSLYATQKIYTSCNIVTKILLQIYTRTCECVKTAWIIILCCIKSWNAMQLRAVSLYFPAT